MRPLSPLLEIRLANSEVGITALPLKIEIAVVLFFHPFRLGDCAGEAAEQMNVVLYATHLQRRAFELFGH